MASALIAEKAAERDGPGPCPSSAQTSPSRRRFLGDGDLDMLLRKAGLALEPSPGTEAGETTGDDDAGGQGGRRCSDGDCRVGQCRMPGMIQRLATIRSFTAMCCALAALTGNLQCFSSVCLCAWMLTIEAQIVTATDTCNLIACTEVKCRFFRSQSFGSRGIK